MLKGIFIRSLIFLYPPQMIFFFQILFFLFRIWSDYIIISPSVSVLYYFIQFHGKKEDTPTSPKFSQPSRTTSSSPRYQQSTRSIQTRKTSVSRKKSRDSCGTEEEGQSQKQAEGPVSCETPESGTSDSPMPLQRK